MRAVIADITDAVMLDMVYEASIEGYQGRKLIMYDKPEPRDGKLKTNSKPVIKFLGEADFENILGKVLGKHRVHEKPGMRAVMDDIIDAIMLNMDEKPGPRDGTLKTNPKYKNVNMDIIDAVMLDKEYEAGIQVHQGGEINMFEEAETRMLKTNPKGKNNVAIPIEDPNTVPW